MKKHIVGFIVTFALTVFVLLVCSAITALAQSVIPPQAITSDQVAQLDNSINTLIPLVPAQYRGALASAIAILGFIALLGRAVIGWRNGGLFGALAGVFGGTNTPKPLSATAQTDAPVIAQKQESASKTPRAASLLILMIGTIAVVFLSGCKGTQALNNVTGNGGNMQIIVPIPGTTSSLLQAGVQFGIYKNTSLIQPVSTNQLYAPAVAITSKTKQSDTLFGSATTNATASVAAGASDINALVVGHASVSDATNSLNATGN